MQELCIICNINRAFPVKGSLTVYCFYLFFFFPILFCFTVSHFCLIYMNQWCFSQKTGVWDYSDQVLISKLGPLPFSNMQGTIMWSTTLWQPSLERRTIRTWLILSALSQQQRIGILQCFWMPHDTLCPHFFWTFLRICSGTLRRCTSVFIHFCFLKHEEDLKHLLNWHLSPIIFKLIIICNFKVSLVALIIDSVHHTFSIQEKSSSSQFKHSFNKLQERWKRYNWILQCGQTPIVLMWLHDRNPHPEQKKAALL